MMNNNGWNLYQSGVDVLKRIVPVAEDEAANSEDD
jgi:hypothetical protein